VCHKKVVGEVSPENWKIDIPFVKPGRVYDSSSGQFEERIYISSMGDERTWERVLASGQADRQGMLGGTTVGE